MLILTVIELVLFFCTFLSLRSHDAGHPYIRIRDHELRGEVEYYGGLVISIIWLIHD